MPIATGSSRYLCSRCLRARRNVLTTAILPRRRGFATSPPVALPEDGQAKRKEQSSEDEERGALSRRLEQMSEEAVETGGRGARKAVEEAGFSEELKRQLEEKILAGAAFRSENASAIAQANLPSSAGRGTRDIAGAQPWTGTEALDDAALRMLNDAHKPLRTPSRIPSPRGAPKVIDTGRPPKSSASSGSRLANARDRSSVYASLKDSGMSELEREQFLKEMKARFQPEFRSVPATLQGLTSLANERIEDAIARGQFENIPRGKGKNVERDYNANSPFIDTTEYFMNKIIQKQDIVPPWIDKQQELVSAVTKFRKRLRNDWKRHAARTIASKGGTLEEQVHRAREYAEAEAVDNPPKSREKSAVIGMDGTVHMSKISPSGDIIISTDPAPATGVSEALEEGTSLPSAENAVTESDQQSPQRVSRKPPAPFRDPTWEQIEHSYLNLAVSNLNSLTRSYNLIAPKIAQKPYYNLARELRSCYADVAPLLANEIVERARAPPSKVQSTYGGGRDGGLGVLSELGKAEVRVHDEDARKGYGLKEFWRDLWRK
jgi:Domain of unknown function (DUF1992)